MSEFDKSVENNVDFLVPFTKSLVELLSKVDIQKWNLIKEFKNLNLNNISDKDGTISVNEFFFDFSVSIIYAGTRNFILTIKGISHFRGFSIIITNKGMLVHSDAEDNPTSEAKFLQDQFLKNYKDPYLLTKAFLDFRQNKYG
tara:strand:+ start:82 stop:510 length:429 start_codon:yes stop_codon:yes gene_type:complete